MVASPAPAPRIVLSVSHYTRVRTKLSDATLLVAALNELGYPTVEVHDQPGQLFGYQGDLRPERADVIVRRKHIGPASNDLGFARQEDGSFEAIISGFDAHRHDTQWLDRLTQAYGYAAALRYARDHGYEVLTDTSEHDGTRRLTLRRVS
jgi:hypothetical protein